MKQVSIFLMCILLTVMHTLKVKSATQEPWANPKKPFTTPQTHAKITGVLQLLGLESAVDNLWTKKRNAAFALSAIVTAQHFNHLLLAILTALKSLKDTENARNPRVFIDTFREQNSNLVEKHYEAFTVKNDGSVPVEASLLPHPFLTDAFLLSLEEAYDKLKDEDKNN